MQKSHVDSVALAASALTATFALTLLSGPFAWMGSIIGLIVLLVLFGFDQEGYRTVLGSLAFSAVGGLCFAVACGAILERLAANGEVHLANGQWQTVWLPLTLAFATAVLWAIDRSRMSARLSLTDRLASRPNARHGFLMGSEAPVSAEASPSKSEDVFLTRSAAVPTSAASTLAYEPQTTYSQEAIAQQPIYAEQSSIPEPQPVGNLRPQSMLTPTISEVARPAPKPIIPRSGKQATIYVNLVGEGLNVMRSVTAEHMGRDYYQITDTMPEGENWQFQPGQVVRCKKQTLSTGKALVAVEEAPRAQ